MILRRALAGGKMNPPVLGYNYELVLAQMCSRVLLRRGL